MFEKSFEEYKKLPKWKGKIFMEDEETCYKDGATFGYNKAKEEMQEQIEKMKCCQNCKFDDFMEEPCCNCSRCFGDMREGYSDKWEIN